MDAPSNLTPCERKVWTLIGKGMKRRQIARELQRSPVTVDKHRSAICLKVGIMPVDYFRLAIWICDGKLL